MKTQTSDHLINPSPRKFPRRKSHQRHFPSVTLSVTRDSNLAHLNFSRVCSPALRFLPIVFLKPRPESGAITSRLFVCLLLAGQTIAAIGNQQLRPGKRRAAKGWPKRWPRWVARATTGWSAFVENFDETKGATFQLMSARVFRQRAGCRALFRS